jgi:hypothetical protein
MIKYIAFLLIIAASTCSKKEQTFSFNGTLEKQGITSYQYGTHVISDGKITYALKSDAIDLDKYVSKKVTIYGFKIEGYPISGGPDYINVTRIE